MVNVNLIFIPIPIYYLTEKVYYGIIHILEYSVITYRFLHIQTNVNCLGKMEQFQFKFTDIYRVGNYGFSFRRIGIHLVGILLAYLIYEILVYLSIFISGNPEVKTFWNSYGILPIPPFVLSGLTPLTTWAMWLGIIIFASIFFLVSTMASKITIEQLRGNVFYSIGNSIRYIKEKWLTVLGSFLGLIAFGLLLLLIPAGIGLLGKIPYAGKPILTVSSLFIPFAFFIGLLAVFAITVVYIQSVFCSCRCFHYWCGCF